MNERRSQAFAARLSRALNEASLVVLTSVGHRVGLFEAMADGEPRTSAALAARAELDERYVREWLAAMTVGRVVTHDPEAETYALPEEHASWLTHGGEETNLAVFAQYVPVMAAVESEIVRCFRAGGGVPYEHYERFHEVMAEDSGQTILPALVDTILPLVPGLVDRFEAGIDALDLGCGRGRALALLAERFPASLFVGYDLSTEAIGWGREHAASLGLANLTFERRDLSTFDHDAEPAAFDFVTTFDAVHDQPKPLALLRGIRRTVRDDGVYLMQDIAGSSHVHLNLDHPSGTFLYAISTMHCMTVSLAQGGDGLGAMWGEELAVDLLAQAGFGDVEVHRLERDPNNAYYVSRPGAG